MASASGAEADRDYDRPGGGIDVGISGWYGVDRIPLWRHNGDPVACRLNTTDKLPHAAFLCT
eukprot:1152185-Pelagomonas_calceolata.AAC.5